MKRCVLDTNIVLGYLRGAPYAAYIEKTFSPLTPPNIPFQSVASVAELESFVLPLGYGAEKRRRLDELIRRVPLVNIESPCLVDRYAEIDAFRQNKHPKHKRDGQNAFAMSDNDIWIAATASVLQATLLTTDKDFAPLNQVFLDVCVIDAAIRGDAVPVTTG